MRVNKRAVALRSGVAFPSLLPSAPFPGCSSWPGRTGAGEPPRAAAAEPRAAPSLSRPPHPAAPPSLCPGLLPAPPWKCRRAGAAGGAGGRARPAGQGCSRCAVPGSEQRGTAARPRAERGFPARWGNTRRLRRRRRARCGGDAEPLPGARDPPCAAPAGLRLSSG